MMRLLMLLVAATMVAAAHGDGAVSVIRSSTVGDVQITMYVGSDRALVRETCTAYLPAGKSELRFRWTDAQIDANSVALHGPVDVAIGGVRRPAGEANTFVWPVEVEQAGSRAFVATYFLKGLKWSASYYLTLDAAAGTASLRGKLHLTNDSKLPLRGAHLALCVAPTGVLDKLATAEGSQTLGTYAVLQDCDLEPGRQRRVTFLSANALPARIVYRADPEASKTEVRKYLRVDLREIAVPGTLPKGHLEVYERVNGKRIPIIGAELKHAADTETEVYLGPERDIVFERKLLSVRKTDVEFDKIGRVSGFDTTEEISNSLRSRLRAPASIELIEKVPGKWDFSSKSPPTKKEANEIRWEFELKPGERREIVFAITRHSGTRAE